MELFFFYLAAATLVFSVAFGLELAVGNRKIRFLKDVSPSGRFPVPKVSIIIPARNEETHLLQVLQSILSQDYENFEIIVIDDRCLFVYLMWRAMLTAIFNNGINWRGTHYSLTELKANQV